MHHCLFVLLTCLLCACSCSVPLPEQKPGLATATYTHEVVLPLQDEAGWVNDWDTALHIPFNVHPHKKGRSAFEFATPHCMPLIPSRMYFEVEYVHGEVKGNQFTAVLFLNLRNISDNPFCIPAIIRIEGALPANNAELPLPVRYTVLDNWGPRIHPNNAWYHPSWFQRGIRVNILPYTQAPPLP
ncbi:MAG: hypothetical protein E7030_07310 [Akkermansiaceae bacterium]|nr:hypothetical protein [Akkermansiaceae bacterium]